MEGIKKNHFPFFSNYLNREITTDADVARDRRRVEQSAGHPHLKNMCLTFRTQFVNAIDYVN